MAESIATEIERIISEKLKDSSIIWNVEGVSMPSPRLADFREGIVPIVRWPQIRGDQKALNQIQKWIDAGKLVSYGEPKPHAFLDQLWAAEESKPAAASPEKAMRSPSSVPQMETSGSSAPATVDLRGFGWIVIEQEFTDGLIFPVGCRITAFDPKQSHKYDSGDFHAAQDCAARIARETGNKPIVASVGGYLRILRRDFLTDKRPETETTPRMK